MKRPLLRLSSPWLLYVGLPLLCGLVSLHRGQDSNWDLLNYHLHNPGAWLQGRIGRDLAPAGLQSYFNPLLDVPYYLLSQSWPPALLGFLMGAAQGFNGILVYWIARRVLPAGSKAPGWLAVAGLLTANFWTELGNTMGDNSTAPFVLWGLLCAIVANGRSSSGHNLLWPIAAGFLAGVATGLKLTNAPYAVALMAAIGLAWSGAWPARLGMSIATGTGSAVGFASTGGYWLWKMWCQFNNPLFPQFGRLFPNPLASAGGITDTSWLPGHVWEYFLWPFIMSLHPLRVGQLHLHSCIWPVVYLLVLPTALLWIHRKISGKGGERVGPEEIDAYRCANMVAWFVALGFVLWMLIFSIARYLVPIELLAPLTAWIFVGRLDLRGHWQKAAVMVLALSAVFTLSGPRRIWEHHKWARQAFSVTTPELADPSHTLIFMGSATPQAWMIPFFPQSLTFAEMGGSFPEGRSFATHIAHLREQARHTYVLRDADPNPWFKEAETAKLAALASAGVVFDPANCRTYAASIGRKSAPYQLCPVN